MAIYNSKSGDQLAPRSILIWRIVQSLVWLIGFSILFCLLFYPTIGIHLFWNILIPIAPILLVVAVGIWRNVCPMASNALFARHMGLSKRKKLTSTQTGKLNLLAIIALFIIVPLRHVLFDTNGVATAILILSITAVAIIMGLLFEWKSGWCSGLCPVHPVEKLYGINNKLSLPNAHCNQCFQCVTPCPDSTPGIHPLSSKKTNYHKIAGFLMVSAFPGFVWGWFQVQDYLGFSGFEQLITVYKMPLFGLSATTVLYLILKRFIKENTLVGIFSASAVSCYYWYRIPALFGFGLFPGDGMLVDLSNEIPEWIISSIVISMTIFIFWWIVLSKQTKIKWVIRPNFANTAIK